MFNTDSKEFLVLVDGNWITALRTGAVAVHSITNFAKNDYKTVGIIGLGNVARATMLVLASAEHLKSSCFDIKIRLNCLSRDLGDLTIFDLQLLIRSKM